MRAWITLLAAALFTTAVTADDYTKGKDQPMTSEDREFDQLDRNDDERLSKTEAGREDTLSAQFASVDQDSDGYVSKSEYTAKLDTETQPSETEPSEQEPSRTDEGPY